MTQSRESACARERRERRKRERKFVCQSKKNEWESSLVISHKSIKVVFSVVMALNKFLIFNWNQIFRVLSFFRTFETRSKNFSIEVKTSGRWEKNFRNKNWMKMIKKLKHIKISQKAKHFCQALVAGCHDGIASPMANIKTRLLQLT